MGKRGKGGRDAAKSDRECLRVFEEAVRTDTGDADSRERVKSAAATLGHAARSLGPAWEEGSNGGDIERLNSSAIAALMMPNAHPAGFNLATEKFFVLYTTEERPGQQGMKRITPETLDLQAGLFDEVLLTHGALDHIFAWLAESVPRVHLDRKIRPQPPLLLQTRYTVANSFKTLATVVLASSACAIELARHPAFVDTLDHIAIIVAGPHDAGADAADGGLLLLQNMMTQKSCAKAVLKAVQTKASSVMTDIARFISGVFKNVCAEGKGRRHDLQNIESVWAMVCNVLLKASSRNEWVQLLVDVGLANTLLLFVGVQPCSSVAQHALVLLLSELYHKGHIPHEGPINHEFDQKVAERLGFGIADYRQRLSAAAAKTSVDAPIAWSGSGNLEHKGMSLERSSVLMESNSRVAVKGVCSGCKQPHSKSFGRVRAARR